MQNEFAKCEIKTSAFSGRKPRAGNYCVHDGFAFALAESHPGCILLTGDSKLRTLATKHAMEVHGVLWVLDEIFRNRLTSAATLLTALRVFSADPTVRLPQRDLRLYIKRYEKIK